MDSIEEQDLLDRLPAKDKRKFLAMKEKDPKSYNAILRTLYGGQSRLRDVSSLDPDIPSPTAAELSNSKFEKSLQQEGESDADYKARKATEERVEQANRDLIQKQDRNYGTALDKGARDKLNALADNIDLKNTDKLTRLAEQKDALAKLKSLMKQARLAKIAANKASKALYKDKGAKAFNDLYEMDDKGRYHFTGDPDFFSVDDYMTVGKRKETTAQELRDTGLFDDELEGIAKEVRDSYKGKKDYKPKEIAGEVRKVQNEFLKEKILEMGKNPDAMLPVYGVKNNVKKYLTGDINDNSMFKLATTLDRLEEKKEAGILTPSEELFLLTMENERAKIDAEKAREDAIKEVAFMLNDKDTLAKLREYGVHDFEGLVDLLSSSGGEEDLSDVHDAYLFAEDLFKNSDLRREFGKRLTEQLNDVKKESQGLRDAAKKGLGSSDIEQVKDATGKNWWLVTASGGGQGNAKGMIREEERNGKKYLVGYTVTDNGNSGYSPNTATRPWYMEEITDGKSIDDMLNGARRNLENNRWLTGNDASKRQVIGKEAWDTQEMQRVAALVGKSLSEAEKLYTPTEIKKLAMKGKLLIGNDGKFKCPREFVRDYAETFGNGDVAFIPGIREEKSDIGKNREKTTINLGTITGNAVDENDPSVIFSFEDLWRAKQREGVQFQSDMVARQGKNGNVSVETVYRDGQTLNKKVYKGQNMTMTSGKNGVTVSTNYNSRENRDIARDIGSKWFGGLSAKEQNAFVNKLGMSKAYIATDAGKKAFTNACADHVYEDPELKKEFIAKAKGKVTHKEFQYSSDDPEKNAEIKRKMQEAEKAQYESYTESPSQALGNRLSAKASAQNAREEQADINARHEANKTFNDEEYAGPTDEELYKELMRQVNASFDYAKAHTNLNKDTASKVKSVKSGSSNAQKAKSQAQKEKDEAEQTASARETLNKETADKREKIIKKNNETKLNPNILDAFEGL